MGYRSDWKVVVEVGKDIVKEELKGNTDHPVLRLKKIFEECGVKLVETPHTIRRPVLDENGDVVKLLLEPEKSPKVGYPRASWTAKYEDTNVILYSWEDCGWKWYTGYPTIQEIEELMDKLDETDIPYSFIRVGDDESDTEHRGSAGYLYVERSIVDGF